MTKPLYKYCIDIPTQFCNPDACGRYNICKGLRLVRMSEMIMMILKTCEMLDMIDKLGEDDEGEDWKNG